VRLPASATLADLLRAAEGDEDPRPCVALHGGRPLPLHAPLPSEARLEVVRLQAPRVVVAWDTGLEVWEAQAPRLLRPLFEGRFRVAVVAAAAPVALTVAEDDEVAVWDLASGERRQAFRAHLGPIASAALSPDGGRAAIASMDRVVELWSCELGERICDCYADALCAAVSRGGDLVVTSGQEGTARLLDAASGRCVQELCDHGGPVNCAAFADGGRSVVTASSDRTLRVFEAYSGRCLEALQLGLDGGPLVSASVSPDSSAFLVRRCTGAEIWSRSPRERKVIAAGERLRSAEFSPDGMHIVTASAGGVGLWSAASGRKLRSIASGGGRALFAGFLVAE